MDVLLLLEDWLQMAQASSSIWCNNVTENRKCSPPQSSGSRPRKKKKKIAPLLCWNSVVAFCKLVEAH